MLRDRNPQNWKLLFFYYNPAEPRLFVAKRISGAPLTLNYARPMAWVIIAVPVAILIVAGFLSYGGFIR